jgi:hypothetical protein
VAQPEPELEPNLISLERHFPSNLTELERICREEWEKLPKYRSANVVKCYETVRYYLLDITALSELEAQAFRYTRNNIC